MIIVELSYDASAATLRHNKLQLLASIDLTYSYFLNQVTKNDEKVIQKETELRDVKEKLESHEKLVQDLDRQYKQAMEEKNILAEQLQAETELCAEAEEMRARYVGAWARFFSGQTQVKWYLGQVGH